MIYSYNVSYANPKYFFFLKDNCDISIEEEYSKSVLLTIRFWIAATNPILYLADFNRTAFDGFMAYFSRWKTGQTFLARFCDDSLINL